MAKTTKRSMVKVEVRRANEGSLWLMIKWGVGARGYVVTRHATRDEALDALGEWEGAYLWDHRNTDVEKSIDA